MASEDHAFSAVLARIAAHPSAQVLAALELGALRMSELVSRDPSIDEESVGATLRELDAAGLVARRVDPGPPLRVLYELTERGAKLAPALGILMKWVSEKS
jgi:DNA-binding HxlR family transcriptional regulator